MRNRLLQFIRSIKYTPIRIKYRLLGYTFGENFIVGIKVNIEKEGFFAGDNVYIGQYSYIAPNTKLGNFCMLSDYINIIGSDHNYKIAGTPTILAGRPNKKPITIIKDDVWIGHGVTIMRGITIGEGSIVAANSVVTHDIEPYKIVAGVPAQYIKDRFNKIDENKHRSFLTVYRKNTK